MLVRARHYTTGETVDVALGNGRISNVAPSSNLPADAEAGWIAPAFFDLQINGCHGISFNSPNLIEAEVRRVREVCRKHGIVELFPTLVTNSYDALAHGLSTLCRACTDIELARAMPGFHLEGPYISAEDGPRGAHPKAHVRPPDWDEFRRLQEAAGGRIKLVTLAPEYEQALKFIEQLVATSVTVAIGHTAATGERIRDAVAAGARLSTHLGNGSHAMLPRHDNYIWEQLACDELWASIIADGHHLPQAVIKAILRVKTPARTILTSDAGSLAGCRPGRYSDWDAELEVLSEGKIVLPGTPYLAGSWAFTDQCVAQVLKLGIAPLSSAIDMAGARPRKLLHLPPRNLAPGEPAELILFDWDPGEEFCLKQVIS